MKILAEYKDVFSKESEKVYIVNTFKTFAPTIHVPTDVCTIVHQNGIIENVEFKSITVIDKAFLVKEN